MRCCKIVSERSKRPTCTHISGATQIGGLRKTLHIFNTLSIKEPRWHHCQNQICDVFVHVIFYLRPPLDERVPPLLLDGDEDLEVGDELRVEDPEGL